MSTFTAALTIFFRNILSYTPTYSPIYPLPLPLLPIDLNPHCPRFTYNRKAATALSLAALIRVTDAYTCTGVCVTSYSLCMCTWVTVQVYTGH